METVAHRGRRLTVRSAEAQRAKRGNERMRMGWDGKRGQKREEREDLVEGFYPIISMDEARYVIWKIMRFHKHFRL